MGVIGDYWGQTDEPNQQECQMHINPMNIVSWLIQLQSKQRNKDKIIYKSLIKVTNGY